MISPELAVVDDVMARPDARRPAWTAIDLLGDAAFDHVVARLAEPALPAAAVAQALRVLVRLSAYACPNRRAEVLAIGRRYLRADDLDVRSRAVAIAFALTHPVMRTLPTDAAAALRGAVLAELRVAHELGLTDSAAYFLRAILRADPA
jgi:hypothetical protein